MKSLINIDNELFDVAKEQYLLQTFGNLTVEDEIINKIDYSILLLKREISCACVDGEYDLFFGENGAYIKEGNVLVGKDVTTRLFGAKRAYFFIVTLGFSVDRLINKYQYKDISFAYLIDSIASVLIDVISQKIQDKIEKNRTIYERYSCGYGDYSISLQQNICNLLNAEKIGVKLTNGGMFCPTKTISAVIGIVGEKDV